MAHPLISSFAPTVSTGSRRSSVPFADIFKSPFDSTIAPRGGGRRGLNAPPPYSNSWTPAYATFSASSSSTALSSATAAAAATTTALATAATAAGSSSSAVSFLQLLLTFVAGGLFFSSVLAAATAVVALGEENVRQVWDIGKLVIRKVWRVFTLGLSETVSVLLRKQDKGSSSHTKKWNWRLAWQTFKEQLKETRKTAVQGVEAIRSNAAFYSAAVGAPGLIPIQYVLDRLMPGILATQLKEGLQQTLADISNPNVRKLTLQEFTAGTKAPKLLGTRVYDLKGDAIAFDVDVIWESDLKAKIMLVPKRLGVKVPVTLANVSFQGTVRVELTPLTDTPPGFGAALVSLPALPTIGLDIDVAGGQVMKVPWLRKELMNGIKKAMQEEILWPKRVVVPSMSIPKSAVQKTVLSKTELAALLDMDPLLQNELKLMEQPMLREHVTNHKPNAQAIPDLLTVAVVGSESRQQ